MSDPILLAENLTCHAPRSTARLLEGVSFKLDRGEFGVLMGGNGSGKTTLLRVLAGLDPPLSGSVRIAGRGVAGFDPERVALVLENPRSQFVSVTVGGELGFALARREHDPHRLAGRLADDLSRFDLADLAPRDPFTLSGGEQQRVLTAAALCQDPPVLLLDDSFLYLGPGESAGFRERLGLDLAKGVLGAVLLATHDSELAAEADQVGILEGGRLTGWGKPESILRRPLPAELEVPWVRRAELALSARGLAVDRGALDPESLARRVSESCAR